MEAPTLAFRAMLPLLTSRRPGLVGLAAALAVALAGCTGSSSTPSTSASSSSPPSVLADDGEVGATTGPAVEPTVPPLHPSVDDYPAGRVVVDPGDGASLLPVLVRIADTARRRSHGLMEVADVPDGVGMWFVYDQDTTGSFWMKGTRTDLDIAWVDDNGRIVAVETMAVCDADPCPTYDPGVTYRTALEVRAGWLADNDVQVGDRVLRDEGTG